MRAAGLVPRARMTWTRPSIARAAAGAGSGGGRRPAPPESAPTPPPPPLRKLPPPPPSLLYLLRTGRPTNAAHAVWAAIIANRSGCFAVDATAGLGGDAVGLARLLGPYGRVLALDLQPSALAATAAAVEAAAADPSSPLLAPVDLRLACHSTLGELLAGEAKSPSIIAFNLGYLPAAGAASRETTVAASGATTTTPDTTLAALDAAMSGLAPGGVVTVASYIGHPGGPEEAATVAAFLEALDPRLWVVSETRLPNRPGAPRLSVAYKKDE